MNAQSDIDYLIQIAECLCSEFLSCSPTNYEDRTLRVMRTITGLDTVTCAGLILLAKDRLKARN